MGALALFLTAMSGCEAKEAPEDGEDVGSSQEAVTLSKKKITLSTGIQMAYLEMGDPAGAPVIFLHGYTDTSRSFYPTIQALLGLNSHLHIYALDQRGHGASSMPSAASCAASPGDCFRPSDLAGDVVAFMNAKGIGKATIVGHSMGSFVAQEMGLAHACRVESVVLIGTGAKLAGNVVLNDYILAEPVEGSWKAGFEAQGYAFPSGVYNLSPMDANADAGAWIGGAWVVDPAASPAFLADILPETEATKMGTWVGAAHGLLDTDNRERLKGFSVPALVLWASEDAIFYDTDEQELRDSLDVAVSYCKTEYYFKQYGKRPLSPDGLQLDDIGHNTQWGAPNEVARDLSSWLRHGRPTKDWYYSADGDPQTIVTEKNAAPIIHATAPWYCP
ncbi:MAG: alpha/beta hydrolase [Polyangiaceae bacterium]